MPPAPRTDVENPDYFRSLCPELAVGGTVAFGADAARPRAEQLNDFQYFAASELAETGFTRWGGVLPAETAHSLAAAIDALVDAGLPPIFVYVYDLAWTALPELLARASTVLGDARVLADLWAWRVPPGKRGWTPHRGSTHLHRRTDGRPRMLNAWVALSEVSLTGACMHVVSKANDPCYPDALDGLPSTLPPSTALPASAGECLVWDANVLHWGGESDSAAPPRRSFSFTLVAPDMAPASSVTRALPLDALTFRARLDAIADSIVAYAAPSLTDGAPDVVSDVVYRWARANVLLRAIAREPGARHA